MEARYFQPPGLQFGRLLTVVLSCPRAQGWGNKTNSWLGFIDSSEKDINSLPDWIEMSPCYEGIT